MNTLQRDNPKRKYSLGLIGAFVSAILAVSCCIVPLVLLALGVSGAWIGNLTALEPYRPIFIFLTLGALGFAFFSVYRKPKIHADDDDCGCSVSEEKRTRMKKVVLWVCTALIFGLLLFPYLVPYVFAESGVKEVREERIVLEVKNMTCGVCPIIVKKSLMRLQGVKEARVTFRPPEANVLYNIDEVTIEDLIEATTKAGYPSAKKGTE